MSQLVEVIDEYFGVVFGIPHASALFAAAWVLLLAATFLAGRASVRRR